MMTADSSAATNDIPPTPYVDGSDLRKYAGKTVRLVCQVVAV